MPKSQVINDIVLTSKTEGVTIVNPRNALGQRVAKKNLSCSDFSVLGIGVEVHMPIDIVRSLLRSRGAKFTTLKAS